MELQLGHRRDEISRSALLEVDSSVGRRYGDLQRVDLGEISKGPRHRGDEYPIDDGAPSRIERTRVDTATRDVSLSPMPDAGHMDLAKVCTAHRQTMKHGCAHMTHCVVASQGMAEHPETVSLLIPRRNGFTARVHATTQSYELTTPDLLLHLERRPTRMSISE